MIRCILTFAVLLIYSSSSLGQSNSGKNIDPGAVVEGTDERVKAFHLGYQKVQKIIETNLIKSGFGEELAKKKSLDSTLFLGKQFYKYTQQYIDLLEKNPNLKISRHDFIDSIATRSGIQYFTIAFDSLFDNNLKKINAIKGGNE